MRDPQPMPTTRARLAATWRRYLRFWGTRHDQDFDDELRFHFDMLVADYLAQGLAEPEARAAARARLGDLDVSRTECLTIQGRREKRAERARLLDAFALDVRYALRTLRRQKGWTAVAVITLALGIGANAAVLSVVDNLLLHPLPYPHADRMVVIYQQPGRSNNSGLQVTITPTGQVLRAWRESARSFEDIEAYITDDRMLQPRSGAPAVVHTASILPEFPAFAGQHPLLGRGFNASDIAAGGHVALLGESIWRQRYGGDPRILGRPIELDGELYTVIGIMPDALRLPRLLTSSMDVWLPLALRGRERGLFALGRLRPGVEPGTAARELDRIVASLEGVPDGQSSDVTKFLSTASLVSFRQSLILLMGAVALVLLIATANVAHLLLARSAARQRELAVRAAVGAGRSRLVRQLLTESLVLAVTGCLLGILVGWAGLHLLVALRPPQLTELDSAHLNLATLMLSAALSLLTGLAFGMLGALPASRGATHAALKAGAPSTAHGAHGRLRSLLVVTEMALSTTLLVGATLLVRSAIHLQTMDPGFDPRGLYSVQLTLPRPRYESAREKAAFFANLADRARHLPGVTGVTIAASAPPAQSFLIGAIQVEGQEPPPPGITSFVDYNAVQPDYFRLMRLPIVRGTGLSDTSRAASQVVVNAGFARKYWRGTSVVGKRMRVANNGKGDWMTVVGVVADASTNGLTQDATTPMLYVAGSLSDWYAWSLLVRTSNRNAVAALRALPATLDPYLPPPTILSLESQLRASAAGQRFTTVLLSIFTILAVVLAAVGLYGVMAYSVAQRTREIGIRIALGATRRTVARAVMARGILLAIAGAAIGVVGAQWSARLLANLLYGVTAKDPVSFGLGTVVLLVMAVLACAVPTRRATAVDPVIAIRAD